MKRNLLAIATLSIFLSACGGGGGGSSAPAGPVASTNAFNLQSGYVALVSGGHSKTYTLSGSCTGTLTNTQNAAITATTFAGFTATRVTTIITPSCGSSSSASTSYYNTAYMPLGYRNQDGSYALNVTVPALTTAAHVGDVVAVGSLNLYASGTTVPNGRQDKSYVIEPNTATTAIFNVITKTYDTNNTLTTTGQDKSLMAADGTLTPYSVDLQLANGTHLIGN